MSEITKPKASCVLIIRDGSVLSVGRKNDPAKLGIPGGKVEENEDPLQAAVRELYEETGLICEPSSLKEILRVVESSYNETVVTYWAPDPGGDIDPKGEKEGVAIWAGWPSLLDKRAPFAEYNEKVYKAYVDVIPDAWIRKMGSGTLLRAKEEGMRWNNLYLEERVAAEFGYEFKPVCASRLTIGDALAEGDSRPTTETCWWTRMLRYRFERWGENHKYKVVHARVTEDEEAQEGIAILCEPSPRPHWLPAHMKLIAFTVDKDGRTVNPC